MRRIHLAPIFILLASFTALPGPAAAARSSVPEIVLAANLADNATDPKDEGSDSVESRPDTSRARRKRESRFYYGGNLGLSISGNYTYITVQPLVGYKVTPKLSFGAKTSYEYQNDRRHAGNDSHNYGGGAFGRYRFTPQAFAQLEFSAISYDLFDGRTTVPFLFLGGGYARPLGGGTYLVLEVLVDLIQDDNSPFEHYEPRLNVGINAGF